MISKLKQKWNSMPITVKASTSYALCSIVQRSLSFITLPLFTRMLTTEEYGEATLYYSWASFLSIFITLNLAYGSFSTAMVKYKDERDKYISSIQGICLALSCVFLVGYLPFRNYWNKLLGLPTFLVIVMVMEQLATLAIQLWSGKKRFEYKYKSVIGITLIMSIISPILSYIFVINSTQKGYARILGGVITTFIFGLIIFLMNIHRGKKLYCGKFWKYAFGFNIPLLAYYLSQIIFNQSDRIMISKITGNSDAALYGVAYNFAMILTFVLNAINNSYVPWQYEKIEKNQQSENRKVAIVIAGFMAILLLIIIWFAPEVIVILAGKQYEPAVWVVPSVAMSLLLLFYSQLSINVEFYYQEKKDLIYASIGAAVVNIVLNALFIPIFGFVAAGYATLISYIIFAICNYIALLKILKKRNLKQDMFDVKKLIMLFVGFMIIGFLGVVLYDYFLIRIIITIIVFLVFLLKRNLFIEVYKKIKDK
ncbi:lipopolysaccharide biosynthesis protein [Clostridium sp. HCP1S3_B4]|uniref:lipopolysaccharide biosynthesis protein n=1 Tax=unclassified Clostridium TaxID=2614128 RepID=UPI003F8C87D4